MSQEIDIAWIITAIDGSPFASTRKSAMDELLTLRDRLEQAEKDAARYREWQKRFLKDSDTKERTYTDALIKADTPEKVDAVLDAAMQGEGK